ncbi:MAG TPA: ATP phosphoribosyltransferase [Candidatus Anaerofilum faecale]|nr:ATP phosphoribosyltransferase [Candidatus Anaerofilum faecale]
MAQWEYEQLGRARLLPLQLALLYRAAGYEQYRMSRFEEYSLYRENQGFLAAPQVLTFTDLDGRLLALKPDVTLSIAKHADPAPGGCCRYYYDESVYRPSRESHTFQEIGQMGLECIGEVDEAETAAAVQLALDSLALAADGGAALLVLGHMGFAAGLLRQAGLDEERKTQAMRCIHDKNAGALAALCGAEAAVCGMNTLCGPWQEVLPKARALAQDEGALQALEELETLCRRLVPKGCGLELDLSLANDSAYYNGLVFRGQISGLARPVLQGGRYDPLASRFSPSARAVGFAIYRNELERLDAHPCGLLSVALPKGRLGDKVFRLLQKAGWSAAQGPDSRRLVVEDAAAGVRYFLVKPSDVAIYVEHGAADVGIVGKDVLDEGGADVFELLDTGLGRCRMCVAGPAGFADDTGRTLRVATKYPAIAKRHYAAQGRQIDIIKLNGSIELAPLVGLADVIVDIVETGATLRENGLVVREEILPISARLIANRSSYSFKRAAIDGLLQKLEEVTRNDQNV